MLLVLALLVQQPMQHTAADRAEPVHAAAPRQPKRPRRPHLDADLDAPCDGGGGTAGSTESGATVHNDSVRACAADGSRPHRAVRGEQHRVEPRRASA